jgi:hypothetical protein
VRDWFDRDQNMTKKGTFIFKTSRIFVPFSKRSNFQIKKSCKIEIKKFGQITKLLLTNFKIDTVKCTTLTLNGAKLM